MKVANGRFRRGERGRGRQRGGRERREPNGSIGGGSTLASRDGARRTDAARVSTGSGGFTELSRAIDLNSISCSSRFCFTNPSFAVVVARVQTTTRPRFMDRRVTPTPSPSSPASSSARPRPLRPGAAMTTRKRHPRRRRICGTARTCGINSRGEWASGRRSPLGELVVSNPYRSPVSRAPPLDDLIPRLSVGARRVAGAHPEPLARGAAC